MLLPFELIKMIRSLCGRIEITVNERSGARSSNLSRRGSLSTLFVLGSRVAALTPLPSNGLHYYASLVSESINIYW